MGGVPWGKPEGGSWPVLGRCWQVSDEPAKKVVPVRGGCDVTLPGGVGIPATFLVLVTLGKILNPFVPQFLHLSNGNNMTSLTRFLRGLSEFIRVSCLDQRLVHTRHFRCVCCYHPCSPAVQDQFDTVPCGQCLDLEKAERSETEQQGRKHQP